jgi:uncharacterized protein (DUF4415 family)
MKKTAVRYTIDLENPPPLTDAQKAELKALKNMRDEDIDLSDIPELTEEFWRNAKPNPFFRPNKSLTTIRIDADILAWLKSTGKGYQTRLNAILREAMLKQLGDKETGDQRSKKARKL